MKKIFLTILSLILAFSLFSCKRKNDDSIKEEDTKEVSFKEENLKIGQSSKILGTLSRTVPVDGDEGLSRYPTYGESLKDITEDEKKALIDESNYLKSSNTTYDKMDKDGNLYLNGEKLERHLYRHTASYSNYYGSPLDSEKAVIKEITIDPRAVGNHITGLYAPAGEVIKIEISNEDLEKTGGVNIEIGQYSQNNQLNNIWQARNDFNRMPLLGNEMSVDSTTSYVGSFLGGPIYVTPNKKETFTIKISGALEYVHFIYGLTTREEFERLKNTSAPYFDLEIWDSSVRHSGPKLYANLDYDNLMKISALWLQISNLSRSVRSGSNTSIGIDFIYDPFVAAGSAVAFVGRNWCNLPPDWMRGALDYDSFMENGCWGAIHEYNHHFQRYGFYSVDEVTNNALSLLSYISYTNISSDRDKLTGWNRYLNPEYSLKETLSQTGENSSLNSYANLIHTFGVNAFIDSANNLNGVGVDTWYQALSNVTGYNMDYYFTLLNQTPSEEVKVKYQNNTPYIPITLKEQTGRVIHNEDIITVLPYKIPYDEDYEINLDENLTLPEGFSFTVKNITKPKYGTLTKNNNILTYTPLDLNNSGKIYLTVEIKNESLNIKQDETIIFELKPSYNGIDKITYTFKNNPYNSIKDAINNNYNGYDTISYESVNTHFINGVKNNQITIYQGKIYMKESGNYKISIRCSNRSNTRLSTALNSNVYDTYIDSFKENPINLNSDYITYNVKKGDYIYFEVIIESYHPDGFAELFGGIDTLKSINTSLLLNNLDTKNENTLHEDLYKRTYNDYESFVKGAKVLSYTESFKAWDDTFKIENLVDGDKTTSYHSIKGKYITGEPFSITIDLNNVYTLNSLKLTSYTKNDYQNPVALKLYGGTSLDEMNFIKEYQDITYTNKEAILSFDETNLRYYQLIITDTAIHQYVALSELEIGLIAKGSIVNPSTASYYINDNQSFTKDYTLSYFGYVIKGNGKITLNAKDIFGIKIKETNKTVKLIIDDKEETIKINELYYKKIDGNKTITIIPEDDISIEAFII